MAKGILKKVWDFFRKHIGKIAVVGLVVCAVGAAVVTGSPQIVELVAKIVPTLLAGTVTTIGTVAIIAGGAVCVGAGAMKVGYEQGARDERAKAAKEVEASQNDAIDEDKEVAEEAQEAINDITAMQAGQQLINARLDMLEAQHVNLVEEQNTHISSQAMRDDVTNQRLQRLETAINIQNARSANAANAENAPGFFQPVTRRVQTRRRTANVGEQEAANQFSK